MMARVAVHDARGQQATRRSFNNGRGCNPQCKGPISDGRRFNDSRGHSPWHKGPTSGRRRFWLGWKGLQFLVDKKKHEMQRQGVGEFLNMTRLATSQEINFIHKIFL